MRDDAATPGTARGKRGPGGGGCDTESPNKNQKISSVAIGYGVADETGEAPCVMSYEDDLLEMIRAYREQQEVGTHFVHVRKKGTQAIVT